MRKMRSAMARMGHHRGGHVRDVAVGTAKRLRHSYQKRRARIPKR